MSSPLTSPSVGGKDALKRQINHDLWHKNRADKDLEKLVIEFSLQNPHLGQAQVSAQINVNYRTKISPNGVRTIWLREKINTAARRVQWAQNLLKTLKQ